MSLHCKLQACISFPAQYVELPFHLLLSPPSPSVHPQDCGVISSSADRPSLGNCLQVLGLQQGSMRPLRVLPAEAPVQEDVHGHPQQTAKTELPKRVRAAVGAAGEQHTHS